MAKKILLMGAAAAALTLATPAMASAAPPYTVSVGGSSTAGSHPFTAASVGGINFATALNTMSCTSATASGTVQSGTGLTTVATIASTGWSGCTEQFGTPLTVTHAGSWSLTPTGTATSGSTDVVAGKIIGVSAHVADSSGTGLCDFTVGGNVDGSFNEGTQRLVIAETGADSSLTVTSVAGDCLGTIAVGDAASFSGSYAITSPDGAINIS